MKATGNTYNLGYRQLSRYKKEWTSILNQPTIHELSLGTQEIIDDLARIGLEHAQSKTGYLDDFFDYMLMWSNNDGVKPTDFAPDFIYDAGEDAIDFINTMNKMGAVRFISNATALDEVEFVSRIIIPDKPVEGSGREYMRRLVPLSYMIMGTIFLSLSFVFAFTFYLGCHGGLFFIGAWTNLMLLVGAVGLTVTVLVAVIEWRKLPSGRGQEENRC